MEQAFLRAEKDLREFLSFVCVSPRTTASREPSPRTGEGAASPEMSAKGARGKASPPSSPRVKGAKPKKAAKTKTKEKKLEVEARELETVPSFAGSEAEPEPVPEPDSPPVAKSAPPKADQDILAPVVFHAECQTDFEGWQIPAKPSDPPPPPSEELSPPASVSSGPRSFRETPRDFADGLPGAGLALPLTPPPPPLSPPSTPPSAQTPPGRFLSLTQNWEKALMASHDRDADSPSRDVQSSRRMTPEVLPQTPSLPKNDEGKTRPATPSSRKSSRGHDPLTPQKSARRDTESSVQSQPLHSHRRDDKPKAEAPVTAVAVGAAAAAAADESAAEIARLRKALQEKSNAPSRPPSASTTAASKALLQTHRAVRFFFTLLEAYMDIAGDPANEGAEMEFVVQWLIHLRHVHYTDEDKAARAGLPVLKEFEDTLRHALDTDVTEEEQRRNPPALSKSVVSMLGHFFGRLYHFNDNLRQYFSANEGSYEGFRRRWVNGRLKAFAFPEGADNLLAYHEDVKKKWARKRQEIELARRRKAELSCVFSDGDDTAAADDAASTGPTSPHALHPSQSIRSFRGRKAKRGSLSVSPDQSFVISEQGSFSAISPVAAGSLSRSSHSSLSSNHASWPRSPSPKLALDLNLNPNPSGGTGAKAPSFRVDVETPTSRKGEPDKPSLVLPGVPEVAMPSGGDKAEAPPRPQLRSGRPALPPRTTSAGSSASLSSRHSSVVAANRRLPPSGTCRPSEKAEGRGPEDPDDGPGGGVEEEGSGSYPTVRGLGPGASTGRHGSSRDGGGGPPAQGGAADAIEGELSGWPGSSSEAFFPKVIDPMVDRRPMRFRPSSPGLPLTTFDPFQSTSAGHLSEESPFPSPSSRAPRVKSAGSRPSSARPPSPLPLSKDPEEPLCLDLRGTQALPSGSATARIPV
eukprot:RCo003556